MCPDPQLISVYKDGELPSPWKEKMESHLTECSICAGKLESFNRLFNKMDPCEEQKLMEETKDRIWLKLQSKRQISARPRRSFVGDAWRRKLSIPMPAAAAAAAVVIVFAAAVLFGRGSSVDKVDGFASLPVNANAVEVSNKTSLTVAAAEDEIPSIVPAADLSSVLQYLSAERSEIIIIIPPEQSDNFFRAGEPAIIRAADYNARR